MHLDINSKRKDDAFTDKLVNSLKNTTGDALIIAGDIAGKTSEIVNFFEKASELPFEYKFYVPGNHDIWVNQSAENLSYLKYYEILGEIATQFNFDYLPNNPIIIDNTIIMGTMGWYDYSSRNPIWDDKYDMEIYEEKRLPGSKLELMDRHFVKFGMDDKKIAQMMIDDLQNDFTYIEKRIDPAEVSSAIIVTHMVPFAEFIPYKGLFNYDYFTAFFGNLNLGNVISKKSQSYNIHSIFGQCHVPRIKELSPTLFGYCVPIGYPREYGKDINLSKLFKNRIKEIIV